MRVLFIPHPMVSHVMPLLALARRVRHRSDIQCAFLMPKGLHLFGKRLGVDVLDIDRRLDAGVNPEMRALARFRPNVVVDDLSPTTAFISRLTSVPRVSILRKGAFPGDTDVAPYPHSASIEHHFNALRRLNLGKQGLWAPQNAAEIHVGDINVVPSCPEIEVLPPTLRDNAAYRYAGALLLDDDAIMAYCEHTDLSTVRTLGGRHVPSRDPRGIAEALARFLDENRQRKVVYFSIGVAYPEPLRSKAPAIIRLLLDTGAAVVSNVEPDLPLRDARHFFAAAMLPMHLLCSKADLMVHHCGSGAYANQILHNCRAVILGTQTSDRDSVARRLMHLGAANYIPAEDFATDGLTRFTRSVHQLLDESSREARLQTTALSGLRENLHQAEQQFDFAQTLAMAVEGNASGAAHAVGQAGVPAPARSS